MVVFQKSKRSCWWIFAKCTTFSNCAQVAQNCARVVWWFSVSLCLVPLKSNARQKNDTKMTILIYFWQNLHDFDKTSRKPWGVLFSSTNGCLGSYIYIYISRIWMYVIIYIYGYMVVCLPSPSMFLSFVVSVWSLPVNSGWRSAGITLQVFT